MRQSTGKQSGTTLIVALVLILLATLLALFAMNVGIFAQRTSANDVRSRLVQQTAEAGLAQGIEYFNLNSTTALDTTNAANWALCSASDTSFPCGAVDQCAYGASSCTTALARRGNMYYFVGGGTYDVNGNGSTSDVMDVRSLPLDRRIASVGTGFNVNYGVGALLCMVKTPAVTTDPTECTADATKASSTTIITLVSNASIPGESAKTTLTHTIARASSINSATNIPPFTASGAISVVGTFQIATNPNAGGTGVPVSMWTRLAVDSNGTPNTCYFDSFIQGGGAEYEGTSPPVVTCDSCSCADSLSGKSAQGIDIVDIDPSTPQCTTTVTTGCKANLDIKMPPAVTVGEFPCDLFQYVFGDSAWTDTDGDGFCETRKTVSVTATNGHTYTIGEDENYLLSKANYIVPSSSAPYFADIALMTSATITDCNTILQSSTSGMVWDQQGCGFKGQVGTPDAPVVLIEDGSIRLNAGARFFGLLFVRPNLYGPSTGPLLPSTGATANNGATFAENGHATIYGTVVVQGAVSKINGTGAIVSLPGVLTTLGNESALNKLVPVPGSWSDRPAY